MEEIQKTGKEYEMKLKDDPTNKWILECWLALVREKGTLEDAIECSRRRLRKLELRFRYKELNARHRQNIDEMSDVSFKQFIELLLFLQPKLLAEMAKISEEVKRLEEEESIKVRKQFNFEETLKQKHYNYRNFQPVFSKS